jgi:anti-sigma factor RsiW
LYEAQLRRFKNGDLKELATNTKGNDMSCSPFDLRDYFLKELPAPDTRQVESHVRTCRSCQEELERLRLTETALFSLRDEEVPQRIAFVSDKIFEPSAWRRTWSTFWNSGARLGFAGAAMLSIAILVSAMTRPVPVIQPPPAAAVNPVSDAEIQARIDAAVLKAVTESETRNETRTQQLAADLAQARQQLLWAASEFDLLRKRSNVGVVSAGLYAPPRDNPELK